ncbi:hypothetical protein NA57DRAFT_33934 [Rhizodiscina lignyota]|uniref:U6 small nuclear RNA (adenine-(43)-N(6))-methyltransferase n=1 Tax=Rhizodiscina lignyota TaxID=1504668 RepID=A0A9P4MDD0_9PEZI|nr:hypothetical protein NA57DRAFT_33934 [Rhizodiscina lignyota]
MPPNYDDEIDFAALALQDPDFAKVLSSTGKLDFHDAKAVQQLTKSLLKRDFGLQIELPDDRLCPPVPVRYNYVRWIESLIDTTGPSYMDKYDPERSIIGIDIGTGASAIYPLLFCASRPSYRLGATDIDLPSLTSAAKNISLNDLSSRIRLLETTSADPLIPLDGLSIEHADFTICNPPFYSSVEEMQAAFTGEGKSKPPSAVCTGSENEMVTEGGDVGFVLRMVEESKQLKEKVQWYSSMLGKLESLRAVVAKLKEIEVSNWAVCCLRAGAKTRRWAVAWSWGDSRPRNDVARGESLGKEFLPAATELTIPISAKNVDEIVEKLNKMMESLDLRWLWKVSLKAGLAIARENVWSRAARRKQQRQDADRGENAKHTKDGDDSDSDEDEKVALAVKITAEKEAIQLRWLRGSDYVLFESFAGMLKRTVRETGG